MALRLQLDLMAQLLLLPTLAPTFQSGLICCLESLKIRHQMHLQLLWHGYQNITQRICLPSMNRNLYCISNNSYHATRARFFVYFMSKNADRIHILYIPMRM